MSIFGQIVAADEVEDAVAATLNLWFKTYLRELEIQRSIPPDALPEPRAYLIAEELDLEAGMQLPALVVVSPGLSGRPVQEGDGTFRTVWAVAVGIFVSANNRRNTERLVRQYAAVIRAIMLQKRSLGGIADGMRWIDESFDDDFSFVDNQTISAGQVVFEVEVSQAVSGFGGPVEPTPPDPDTQPGSSWPTADTVTATVKTKE